MSDTDQTRMMGVPDQTVLATPTVPGAGVTQQMPAGGIGVDPARTQIGGMATCPVCHSTTPIGETYCGECGFLLASTPAENIQAPVEQEPVAELVDVLNGRRYRLRPGVNTLGRQGADVLVMDGTVSRMHARLTVENGQVIVEDLGSSNGTKVGDRRIGPNQPTPATHGTPLKFGNWRVMLEIAGAGDAGPTRMPAATEATLMAPVEEARSPGATRTVVAGTLTSSSGAGAAGAVARLRVVRGTGKDLLLRPGTLRVGRRPENDLVIPDNYVSGRHAEITTDNTGTYLTDIGSTNGTVINGQKIPPHERRLLLAGDEIQLGMNTYLFELIEEPLFPAAPLQTLSEQTAQMVTEQVLVDLFPPTDYSTPATTAGTEVPDDRARAEAETDDSGWIHPEP
ncbi:MAG: FHA domain-containing protein [Chthonomonadaceae bacterium]|nr:FHA domain-containing protein [Chthonomonadaceae bacterium]